MFKIAIFITVTVDNSLKQCIISESKTLYGDLGFNDYWLLF